MVSPQADVTQTDSFSQIKYDEIHKRLGDSSLALVNVLPHEAFDAGHIPGSISLPVAQIHQRAREVLSNLSQNIAVYCSSFT